MSIISWSQTCKLFFHTIKVKWRRRAKSKRFGLSWLSDWASKAEAEARRREYKCLCFGHDGQQEVHVSTRAKLPQHNENWLGIDKQWQITRAIESSACGKKKGHAFPNGFIIMEWEWDEMTAQPKRALSRVQNPSTTKVVGVISNNTGYLPKLTTMSCSNLLYLFFSYIRNVINILWQF